MKALKSSAMKDFGRRIVLLAALSSVATVLFPVQSAHAQSAQNAQQAAQVALQRSGGDGKVLGVSTETDANGRRVFAVKVLSNDGRMQVMRIPEG